MRDAVVDSRVASRALGEAFVVGPPAVFRPYGLGSYARVAPAQLFRAFVFVAMQALLPPPHFGALAWVDERKYAPRQLGFHGVDFHRKVLIS